MRRGADFGSLSLRAGTKRRGRARYLRHHQRQTRTGILDGYLPGGPYLLTDVLAVITRQVKQDGRQVLFYGDGIDAYEAQIISLLGDAKMEKDRDYDFAPQETRDQSAAAVGRAALRKLSRGETTDFANLLPDYMRQAEAEVKLAAGQLPICHGPKQE